MKCNKCKREVEELTKWQGKWLCKKCLKKEAKKYQKELDTKL